jgi:hypothetical protein
LPFLAGISEVDVTQEPMIILYDIVMLGSETPNFLGNIVSRKQDLFCGR